MNVNPDSAISALNSYFTTAADSQWLQYGYFSYQLNGKATDIIEPWRTGRTAAGAQLIQSLRSSQQYQLLLSADWQQLGPQQNCELYYQQGGTTPAKASYQITETTWYCRQANQEWQGIVGPYWHFFPLLRIFSGTMLQALEQAPGELLLPDIEMGTAPEHKLQPKLDHRQSFRMVEKANDGQHFGMRGGHYQEQNAGFVLNDQGLLMAYHWQQDAEHLWQINNHILPG